MSAKLRTGRAKSSEKRATSALQVNDGGLTLLCMRFHCLAKKLEPLLGRGAVQNSTPIRRSINDSAAWKAFYICIIDRLMHRNRCNGLHLYFRSTNRTLRTNSKLVRRRPKTLACLAHCPSAARFHSSPSPAKAHTLHKSSTAQLSCMRASNTISSQSCSHLDVCQSMATFENVLVSLCSRLPHSHCGVMRQTCSVSPQKSLCIPRMQNSLSLSSKL